MLSIYIYMYVSSNGESSLISWDQDSSDVARD